MIECPPDFCFLPERVNFSVHAFPGRKIAVVIGSKHMLIEHGFTNRRQHLAAFEIDQTGIGVRIERWSIGQVIAVIRTISRVQVDDQMGVPTIEETDQRIRFARFELYEIAIEVKSFRITPDSDSSGRTVLSSSVIETDLL